MTDDGTRLRHLYRHSPTPAEDGYKPGGPMSSDEVAESLRGIRVSLSPEQLAVLQRVRDALTTQDGDDDE